MSAMARVREASPTESSSSHHTGSDSHPQVRSHPSTSSHTFTSASERPLSSKDLAKSKENWAARYSISDAWTDLAPHKEEVVRGLDFTGRQVAWSTGGEWCVVVGSAGVVAIFERWGGVV
jgi:polycomb protein EED